jgi:hypothetical protein
MPAIDTNFWSKLVTRRWEENLSLDSASAVSAGGAGGGEVVSAASVANVVGVESSMAHGSITTGSAGGAISCAWDQRNLRRHRRG